MSNHEDDTSFLMALLSEEPLGIKRLQTALANAGYTENYNRHTIPRGGEPDGIMGPDTLEDICAFCEYNPIALTTMGQGLKEKLLKHSDFRQRLMSAVAQDPVVAYVLRQDMDEKVGDGHVQDLSSQDLKVFQANAALLGTYHKKIDGDYGPGTQAAFEEHLTKIQDEATPALPTRSLQDGEPLKSLENRDVTLPSIKFNPPEPVRDNFNEAAVPQASAEPPQPTPTLDEDVSTDSNIPTNGYGVPIQLIDNAWARVEGRESEPFIQAASYQNKTLLVIDLGHGAGRDKGAGTQDFNEVSVVDPLGEELARQVKEQYSDAYDVVFTREPGETFRDGYTPRTSLEARGNFANAFPQYDQVRLISLHANASATSSSAHGTEVFAASTGNGNGHVDQGGCVMDPQSYAFAEAIARNFHLNPDEYATVRTADATVIESFDRGDNRGAGNGSSHVACLLEVGYLIGDREELMSLRENPAPYAQQILSGLMDYEQSIAPSPSDIRLTTADSSEPATISVQTVSTAPAAQPRPAGSAPF